jgi:hypothetical protein
MMRIFDVQAGRDGHVDECVQPEEVDLAGHQVGHAWLPHAEPASGFRWGPALTRDVLLERDHQHRAGPSSLTPAYCTRLHRGGL